MSSLGNKKLNDEGLQAGGADSLMSNQRLQPTSLSKVVFWYVLAKVSNQLPSSVNS